MKTLKCEEIINKIQWNQLRIAVRDDLPVNALAGAFGDTIVFSRKLIQMVKKGLVSKASFLFIFLHELVHIAQQALLSERLSMRNLQLFISQNRVYLEIEADYIAFVLASTKMWMSLVSRKNNSSLKFCSNKYNCAQYWMVDGPLSTMKAGEINRFSEIEKRKKILEKIENDLESYELVGINHAWANAWVDLQASAKTRGIHEGFTMDAFNELWKNIPRGDNIRKFTELEINAGTQDLLNYSLPCNTMLEYRKFTVTKGKDKLNKPFYISTLDELNRVRKIDYFGVRMGASFNDRWFYTNAAFAVAFIMPVIGDQYLNSSHEGPMQFLHSMDCSGGKKKENLNKILRWVDFCVDVFNNIELTNGKKIQNISLKEYVSLLGEADLLRDMFSGLMKTVNTYKNKCIRDFFGLNENGISYDPGSVAIGSVVHMIQDSFALSHVKRCFDPFLVYPCNPNMEIEFNDNMKKRKEKINGIESLIYETEYTGKKITAEDQEHFRNYLKAKAMPIILFADYTKQSSGKHSHADIFVREISADDSKFENFYEKTLNSSMARDCSEAFMYMVLMDYCKKDILNFVESLYPLTSDSLHTTKSGLQYYKKIYVDSKYGSLKKNLDMYESNLEKLMCYNVKESLSSRIDVYFYVINNLKHLLLCASLNLEARDFNLFVFDISEHFSEIVVEINEITKLMEKECSKNVNSAKKFSMERAVCKTNAVFLQKLIRNMIDLLNQKIVIKDNRKKIEFGKFARNCNLVLKKIIKERLDSIAGDHLIESRIGRDFVVIFYTGDKNFAGTKNNDMYLTLVGLRRTISDRPLINYADDIDSGDQNLFTVKSHFDIGDLKKIKIRQTSDDKWYLEKVIVLDVVSEKKWIFIAEKWIEKDSDASLLYNRSYFKVDVATSDNLWAGTNSDIYISIIGTKGKILNRKLDNGKDNFESGDLDSFVIQENKHIGDILEVKIKNDGSVFGEWRMEEMTIKDIIKEKEYYFSWHLIENNVEMTIKPKFIYNI